MLETDVLLRIVRKPFAKHADATIERATFATLLHAAEATTELVQTEGIGLPAAKNCVLHAVMFHCLGGFDAGVLLLQKCSCEARCDARSRERALLRRPSSTSAYLCRSSISRVRSD